MKAKEIIPPSRPRNFVAKNQQTSGAGAHRNKKQEQKRGYQKHRGQGVEEGAGEVLEDTNNWLGINHHGSHFNLKLDTDDEEEVKKEFQRQYPNHTFIKFVKNPKPILGTGPVDHRRPISSLSSKRDGYYAEPRPSPDNPWTKGT